MKFLNKLFGRTTGEEAPVAPLEETLEPEAVAEPVALESADSEVVPQVLDDTSSAEELKLTLDDPHNESAEGVRDTELLSKALRDNPSGAELHAEVVAALSDPIERVDFYHRLVDGDTTQPYHSLSLGRAFREAGRFRESVSHYQLYLRSTTEALVLEELAEVFEELGESYMASSSRMVAQSLRKQG